jgi:hypothetical protein
VGDSRQTLAQAMPRRLAMAVGFDHAHHIDCVFAHPIDQARLGVVQPRESNEERAGVFGYATFLDGVSIRVDIGSLTREKSNS